MQSAIGLVGDVHEFTLEREPGLIDHYQRNNKLPNPSICESTFANKYFGSNFLRY